jgi:uncharacterized membrane protein
MRIWRPALGRPAAVILGVVVACVALGAGADWLPLDSPYKRHLAAGMLQLVLLTLAAGYLAACWVGRVREEAFTVSPGAIWCAVIAGIVAYAAGLSYLSIVRHQALLTGVWDLGYYAQLTWDLANLRAPRSSVWGSAPWGNHATFILIVAAPFLRLFPDPATLLILQSITLALGALPAFFLGRQVWGNPLAGAVTAGVYLLYPPLQFANLFDFHADTFATPLLLAAFAALFAGRIGWALLWAAMLIVVKEDMALVSVTFGLYVAAIHRRWSGLALATMAAVAFGLFVWVLIPSWIQTPYFSLFNRWPHLGASPWEITASPLLRPSAFWGTVLQPERVGYLILLLIPLAGLPLWAPEILAVGLPPLASNFLSGIEMQYTIRGHYTAALTPILIVAAVVGSHRAGAYLKERGRRPSAVLAGLVATSVAASLAFSPLPWSRDPFARKHFWDVAPNHTLAGLLAAVPADASVSAANHLGAHLALRRMLDLFPGGADTADFVLVDVGGLDYIGPFPKPELFRPLLRRLVETRPLVAVEDGLALFGRGEPSPDTIARLVNLRTVPGTHVGTAGNFALAAASVNPSRAAPRTTLRARYTWISVRAGQGIPCIAETLVSAGGVTAWEIRRPMFHALLSGERWPAGSAADDGIAAVVPETVPPGPYDWVVTTWYDPDSGTCRTMPQGAARLTAANVSVRPW